jgi:hypothetical protein
VSRQRTGLRGTGQKVKPLLPFFEALAKEAGLSTRGVSIVILGKGQFPECQYDKIRLPDLGDDIGLYARRFIHELQHARDNIDGPGMTLGREEMEARARKAENLVPMSRRREILCLHGFGTGE